MTEKLLKCKAAHQVQNQRWCRSELLIQLRRCFWVTKNVSYSQKERRPQVKYSWEDYGELEELLYTWHFTIEITFTLKQSKEILNSQQWLNFNKQIKLQEQHIQASHEFQRWQEEVWPILEVKPAMTLEPEKDWRRVWQRTNWKFHIWHSPVGQTS